MMTPRSSCALLLLASSSLLAAQNPAPDQTQTQPAYTIQANARVVLTDVTVQDERGNPIHNLPVTAFHLTDNKNPQPVASFEEHTAPAGSAMPVVAPPAAHGVYSNDYLLNLPPVLDVVLIDLANIDIADQMYLNYQLTRFLNALPAGQSLAIYLRAQNGCFLLQNFTADHQLLLAALHKAIPRFPPLARQYLSDTQVLLQMSTALDNLPGRKNILWFAGGSTAYLRPDNYEFQQQAGLRYIYDELQRERIALYPIDARGLTMLSGRAMWAQHGDMSDAATATGGQAFFDTNGIEQAATRVVQTDGSYYTLTYIPHDLRFDNKWHKVRITVDAPDNTGRHYTLSYRRGYFADGSLPAPSGATAKPRTRLLANGEQSEETPTPYVIPIIFSALVLATNDPALAALSKPSIVIPADQPQHGTYAVSLRYTLPASGFAGPVTGGERHISLGLAAIALNHEGRAIDRKQEQVTLAFKEDQLRNPRVALAVDQQLNLHKGDEFLVLAVWDKNNNRIGSLQVPLELGKKK